MFFFFKQKTAYEMRISDWSSDVVLFRSSRTNREGGIMLQYRSVKRAELNEQLRTALPAKDNHFFADTSFLITAASLHPVARSDLDSWIAGLGNRFHDPAWVRSELFGKITVKTEQIGRESWRERESK